MNRYVLDFVADHMTIHFNMLCAFMEYKISSNLNCASVVAVDHDGSVELIVEVMYKRL